MKQNRRDNGGLDLEFDGWENLAGEQRDQLAQRLKYFHVPASALQDNDDTQSRPVDLDMVAARLREISDNQDALPPDAPPLPPSERISTPLCDEVVETRASQTIAYHELVKNGGRIPVWDVSHEQRTRWKAFRNWQKYNRGIYDEDEEFAAYFEEAWRSMEERQANMSKSRRRDMELEERRRIESLRAEFKKNQEEKGLDDGDAGFLAFAEEEERRSIEAGHWWSSMTKGQYRRSRRVGFNHDQSWRYKEYYLWLREDNGRGGFPEYVAEAKRRLARHGFTRTFQLDKDPAQQDKLTTWIEYLNYEYSWHDRYERSIERLQPKCDEAWEKLVDSGVLRPGETYESVRTVEAAFRLSAKEALRMLERRSDLIINFIRGNWDLPKQKNNLHRQRRLLQWILEQVPLIEAELNEPKRSRLHQDAEATDDSKPTKRKRGEPSAVAYDMVSSVRATRSLKHGHGDERPPKRLRKNAQHSASHSAVGTSEIPKDRPSRRIETSQSRAIPRQPVLKNSPDADARTLAGRRCRGPPRAGTGPSFSFAEALALRLAKALLSPPLSLRVPLTVHHDGPGGRPYKNVRLHPPAREGFNQTLAQPRNVICITRLRSTHL
ncbi:hypothetical protein N658DRAFT_489536 [Parathielavia hyrcaniae]|uniref:Ankyrin 2,3/unc44 n=1 Tax=Parathielavia hyrcaniae TaxID=113614 RepID=A0AAN6PUQ9_9PEZI|nr:hypothetical protein N658DRAFT_489536 [Parathielavia hyrcaniae]